MIINKKLNCTHDQNYANGLNLKLSNSKELIKENFDVDNKITLYYGDCIKLLKSIPSDSVQLIITSPPYNLGKEYEKKQEVEEYFLWQKVVVKECYRVLKNKGSICWQIGNYVEKGEIIPLDILLYPIFQDLNMKLRNRIIWHFGHGLHATKRFSGRYETIMWFTKNDNYYFNLDSVRVPQKYPLKKYFKGNKKGELSCHPKGKNPSDIWDIPNVKSNHVEKTEHPCQFPIGLVERLVLSMSKENDIVLDPFMGSGSVFIAALKNNRKCVGSEIEKKYVDISKRRILGLFDGTTKIREMNQPVYVPKD